MAYLTNSLSLDITIIVVIIFGIILLYEQRWFLLCLFVIVVVAIKISCQNGTNASLRFSDQSSAMKYDYTSYVSGKIGQTKSDGDRTLTLNVEW